MVVVVVVVVIVVVVVDKMVVNRVVSFSNFIKDFCVVGSMLGKAT